MKRSWLAVLLNMLVPGLGHVYAGMPARGALAFGVIAALSFGSWRLSSQAARGDAIPDAATVGLALGGVLLPLVWMIVTFQAGAFVEARNPGLGAPVGQKRPVVAALLNVVPVGMGYFYLYRWWRGTATYLAAIVLLLSATSAASVASVQDALEGGPSIAAVIALVAAVALLLAVGVGTALDAARIARGEGGA